MNNNEIDKVIKDSLAIRVNKYELRDEVFTRVKDNLSNPEKLNNFRTIKIRFNRTNSLKAVGSFMCGVIIVCSLLLLISPDARVFASDTVNAIKAIFVVDDNGQVVKKGLDEPILDNGFGISTDLSDSDITKKVGFNVVIPKSLPDGFSLSGKWIGVFLGKDISYETNEKINSICQKAILDDSALESLKEYNPSRYAGGVYSSTNGEIALLVNKLTDRFYKEIEALKKTKTNYKEIKIGDIAGIWIEQKRPLHPNGDMTQKPLEVINTYDMGWVSNDLFYFMSTSVEMDINRCNMSPEMGKRIAESFMASQK